MKRGKRSVIDPVIRPSVKGARPAKDAILAIRMAPQVKEWIEAELEKLQVEPKHRAHFYRGAILAAIGNVKRAQDPGWKLFLKAIQPAARRHLGAELELGGAESIENLGYDGPTIAF